MEVAWTARQQQHEIVQEAKGAVWVNRIIGWLSGLRYPGNTRKKVGMYTISASSVAINYELPL